MTSFSGRRSLMTATAALALLAGFLVLFVGGGARFAIGLTFKPIVEHFGWDRSDLGLAVAAFQVVSAIAMFIAGYLADRTGPLTWPRQPVRAALPSRAR